MMVLLNSRWSTPVTERAIDQIVIEVSINVGRHDDWFTEWFWGIVRHQFFGTCVDGVFPIVDLLGQIRVFGFFCTNADSGIAHLVEISIDPFGTIEMCLEGIGTEA